MMATHSQPQTVQKDAILRQMKQYKRDKEHLEKKLSTTEDRVKSSEERIIALDSWLQQVSL
jgi:E3 ubiquitin-protein ligase BRE1